MAKTNSASINLLKNNKNDTLEQLVNWSLTIGRVLVIVVELVALAAFLYRFTLDQQLVDLHTTIKQKQAIVNYLKSSEDTYRNLQDRLSVASTFGSAGEQNVKIFEDIVSFAPSGMTFTNVSFNQEGIGIEANVDSVVPLSAFVSALKSYSPIESVSIDKIENKTSNAIITVSMTIILKQPKGVNANTGN